MRWLMHELGTVIIPKKTQTHGNPLIDDSRVDNEPHCSNVLKGVTWLIQCCVFSSSNDYEGKNG